ncbi:hypothetical protein C8F04DRAFT_1309499 [Mycena alexandri]|uniref:Uncharacterized protein n=1 Tax=Mycena alexandri TaxID=1745969 RepID=A0AAD6XCZ9_9AGAR|nr:hypothetical protein C8F04DRAFT_1309499 [Mycena alexandri]
MGLVGDGPRSPDFQFFCSNAQLHAFENSALVAPIDDSVDRWNSWGILPTVTSELLLGTLTSCPQLRFCKLRVVDTSIMLQDHPMLELPFLHTFELDYGGSVTSTFAILLRHLSLPSLRTFTLHGSVPQIGEQPPFLVDFFALWTQLEMFEIQSEIFSNSFLVESLRSLPAGVRRLTIHDSSRGFYSVTDDALAGLSAPALQEFVITHGNLISDAALLRFITARMSEDHFELRRIEVHFCRTRVNAT